MYKKTSISIIAIFVAITSFCQSPQSFSFQGIVKDASGNVLQNTSVGVQISILQGSEGGSALYTETHTVSTNSNGLLTLSIGDGTVIAGDFTSINWAADKYFIKTEYDINGGTTYTLSSTSQLLSVPYALHATNSTNATNATNAENVNFDNLPTTYPELKIEDSLIIGNSGVPIMGIVEVTGTTDASDNFIEVNFPAGYNNTNSCVLSVQILTHPFINASTNYGLGYSGTNGTLSYELMYAMTLALPPAKPVITNKIKLNYPDELKDKSFSVVLMKYK